MEAAKGISEEGALWVEKDEGVVVDEDPSLEDEGVKVDQRRKQESRGRYDVRMILKDMLRRRAEACR